MFCCMNFTTTGIEFRTSRPRILRVEYYPPLTAAVPVTEKQLVSEVPISATKATQADEMAVVAPQLGQKRAAQDSSAKPKKARKKPSIEDLTFSSSSSSTSSSSSWSLPSSPSTTGAKDRDRRSRDSMRAQRWFNAESSSSLSDDGHSCGLNKKDTSKASYAGQPIFEMSKDLANRKNHQSQEDSQPVKNTAIKGPPPKRVRFAMDVEQGNVPPQPDPPCETSSSDGSDCSYIDLPPSIGPEAAVSGHAHLSNASESRRYRPATITVIPHPAKRFADKPIPGLPLRSNRQSATSKTPSRTRRPDPVVVMGSALKKKNRKEPSSQLPVVIKTALKNSSTGQRSTACNDDKENSLQCDERLGLTFRDL